MTDTVFRVPRATGTHADVLLTAGLADLLQTALPDGEVRIVESGATFEVTAPSEALVAERLPADAGFPFLRPKAKVDVPAKVTAVFDYEVEKEKVGRYFEVLKARGRKTAGEDPEQEEWLQRNQPRPDWKQWQVLLLLQGHANTNRAHTRLAGATPDQARAEIAAGLAALQAGQPSGVKWGVSSVQLFNPAAAKGYARLKPDSTDRNDKSKEQWVDDFQEWLRYRGYFAAVCPVYVDRKAERIRLIAPIPADISAVGYRSLAEGLRQGPLGGAEPRVDALAVLRLARLLIEHSDLYTAAQPADEALPVWCSLADSTPARVISGIAITQYQSLGSARAVSQLGSLALPDWFPMHSVGDAERWLGILEEHRRVIAGLRDDRSDEVGLAQGYRRFLQKRGVPALDALIDFMGAYGTFVLRAREQKRRVASFTTSNLRELVRGMSGEYLRILDDPGFQAVAAAVRRATVGAQALKAQGKDYREIRYELLHDIRRKRSLPKADALIEAVADFVASYNYENARRREMKKLSSRNVTTEEFHAFTAVVEEHGAALVGALLAAYGSCREPREDVPETLPVGESEGVQENVTDVETEPDAGSEEE